MASFEGGCQCGAVRYTVTVERPIAYACHCLECQKQSASAFGLSVPVPSRHFEITGTMGVYRRPTDIGGITVCWFCEACGTRLYHQSEGESDSVTIKGGSLDRADLLDPIAHIWIKSKQPWVILPPDVPSHQTQPDDLNAWRRQLIYPGSADVPLIGCCNHITSVLKPGRIPPILAMTAKTK